MKRIKQLLFALLIFGALACSKDDNTDDTITDDNNSSSDQPGDVISPTAYENLNNPCIDNNARIILPGPLKIDSIQNFNEYVAEMIATVEAGNGLISGFSSLYFPPSTSIVADPDDFIYLDEVGNGYLWEVDGERYLYLLQDDGYTIYYLENENALIGDQLLYVEQNEDCSKFKLVQYDPETESQNAVFSFNYTLAGTAQIMQYGEDYGTDDELEYYIRKFADGTGEYTKKSASKNEFRVSWDSDGTSGTYTLYNENGAEISSEIWEYQQ